MKDSTNNNHYNKPNKLTAFIENAQEVYQKATLSDLLAPTTLFILNAIAHKEFRGASWLESVLTGLVSALLVAALSVPAITTRYLTNKKNLKTTRNQATSCNRPS